MKHIASVSFGKDSVAMLIELIKRNYPLDEVVFYDTGMEFQPVYDTRDRMKEILDEKGIKFTQLEPDEEDKFIYKMFDKVVHERNGGTHKGYSWCGGRCRWGTSDKLKYLDRYTKGAIVYLGIAADETKRLTPKPNKVYPLEEWGMTEADCLKECYDNGFFYEEDGRRLYDILDRLSCWCCGNKNIKELRNYHDYLPKYWEWLKELQARTTRPFKKDYSIFDLDNRFEAERNIKKCAECENALDQ